MRLSFLFICICVYHLSYGQINIKGKVIDLHDLGGLGFATIKEKEHNESGITDSLGYFELNLHHAGIHTFTISHIGCKKNMISLHIDRDTFITFYLDHDEKRIKNVSIKGTKTNSTNLQYTLGKDIGNKIQELPGGSLLQSGNNVNKPVINGIHSHRLVLNYDNIRFESQQWGAEHAPEIDPNALQRMRWIRGSEAYQYGSEAVSGALKFEPEYNLADDKKISGSLKMGYAMNGHRFFGAGAIKGRLFKKLIYFAQTTAAMQGNLKAPNYYLTNTGLKEWNFSSGLSYDWKGVNFSAYYSRFYNELGILASSHIGNLQDLQEAIVRGNPANKGSFSYFIDNPSQKVYHEIIKGSVRIPIKKNHLTFHLSNQYNLRNEYDFVLNVANRKNPVSNLKMSTQQFQGIYQIPQSKGQTTLSAGGQYQQNNFGGTFLIPKYQSIKYYAFWFKELKWNEKIQFNSIARFDGERRNIYDRFLDSITSTKDYNDFTLSMDVVLNPTEQQEHRIQVASGWRPPHIIEMYSDGIHHGAASYEIGNDSLKKERNIGINYHFNYKFPAVQLNVDPYFYYYFNYINAAPSGALTQTIRGFFPTWRYSESNVLYFGINASCLYQINNYFQLEMRYQHIKIQDVKKGYSLPYTPQNALQSSLKYKKTFEKKNQTFEAVISGQYFFRRNDVDTALDYALPPEGYPLVNINFNYHFKEKKLPLLLEFSVNNIFNTAYRSYMDRLRYFSDARGIDFQIKAFVTF